MSWFVAVDLDSPTREAVFGLMEKLRARHAAKWLRPDKLHVTLQYLAHPDEAARSALQVELRKVAARHAPLSLQIAGAGTFVTARAPSVLWLGVAGELDALAALQRDVATASGITDDRAYVPHLTLARGTDPAVFEAFSKELSTLKLPPFEVKQLTLYESANDVYRVGFAALLRG